MPIPVLDGSLGTTVNCNYCIIFYFRVKQASKCLEELFAHIETKKNMVDNGITNNADQIKTIELLGKLTEIMIPLVATKTIESHTF